MYNYIVLTICRIYFICILIFTQEKAHSQGLWNLFLPVETDSEIKYGAGLTNLEYAHLAEIMGQSVFASEVHVGIYMNIVHFLNSVFLV